MWSHRIVLSSPALYQHLHLQQCVKDLPIQQLVPPGQAADDCVYSLAWALAAADSRPLRGKITFSFDGESSTQSPEEPYPGGAGIRIIGIELDPRSALSPERIAAQRFAERRRYRW